MLTFTAAVQEMQQSETEDWCLRGEFDEVTNKLIIDGIGGPGHPAAFPISRILYAVVRRLVCLMRACALAKLAQDLEKFA
jgi:hypothetical protein